MDIHLLSANHLQLVQLHSMLSITVWIPLCSALGAFFADTCDNCLTADSTRPLIPTPRDIGNVTSRGHIEPCHVLLLVITLVLAVTLVTNGSFLAYGTLLFPDYS